MRTSPILPSLSRPAASEPRSGLGGLGPATASAPRKADRVADALLRAIVSGEHAVGSVLPKEDDLAQAYGVNRGVIREAIKLLEVHRLVHPVRRRGTVVLDPMESLSAEVLAAMLQPKPGVVSQHLLAGLLELRATLDVEMSTLAAVRRTSADLDALDSTLARVRQAMPSPDAFLLATEDLARALAKATHNPLYEMLVCWHHRVARDLAHVFGAVRQPSEPYVQGLELLGALVRQGDVEGVRALVTSFHAWATPRLLAVAAGEADDPFSAIDPGGSSSTDATGRGARAARDPFSAVLDRFLQASPTPRAALARPGSAPAPRTDSTLDSQPEELAR